MNELDRDMTVKEWRAKQISEEKIDRETGEVVEAPPVPARAEMRPLASPDVTEVCKALARAQGTMEAPQRTKKGKIEGTARSGRDYSFEYAYAPLEEILRVLRKPFLESDLCLQQYIVTRAGQWFVRTILWHQSGQWLSSDYPVFAEQMTGQKFAGAVTYAKRQGLCLVCAIAPEDDQDLQEQAEAPPAHVRNGAVVPVSSTPQRATRANPAAAPPANPETDRARAAYKKIQMAIDNSKSARDFQEIYDGVLDEWGEGYQWEASLIGELHSSSLDLLKSRIAARMREIPQPSQQTLPTTWGPEPE